MQGVIVVGAGAVGCACALRLARGGQRVMLVERAQPASEASSAAAGILIPEAAAEVPAPLLQLWLQGLATTAGYAALAEELSGMTTGYRETGRLVVALDEAEAEALAAQYALQAPGGVEARWLSGAEARALESALSPSVRGAIFFPTHAQVEAPRYSRALYAAARRAGVDARLGQPVTAIEHEGGRVVGVRLGDERLAAEWVVLAAGSWSGTLPGARCPVRPLKGQIVRLEPVLPPFRHIVSTLRGSIVPWRDGHVLVGATFEEAGYDKRVTADGLRSLLDNAVRACPALGDARVVDAWAGLRPASPDGLPIIGEGVERGLVYATAHRAMGILLAGITAEVVAALIAGEPPPIDPAPFSPLRFGA